MEDVGSLEHWHCCRVIAERNLAPSPSPSVLNPLMYASQAAMDLWRTRGIGGFRIFVPGRSTEGEVQWLITPRSHVDPATLDWYIDASLVDGTLGPCARYGAAGVAVDDRGHLVAAWKGVPPAYVDSIGEAEAWALATVLLETPARRRVLTDCKANLDFLAAGHTAATASNMRGARVWRTIFAALDREQPSGDDTYLHDNDWLVWLPAHKSKDGIGKCLKSNGECLNCVDWLANATVDRLAKEAADAVRVCELDRCQFLWAREAAAHWRSTLGTVTFLANNHVVTTCNEEGEETREIHRDSDGKPTTTAARKQGNPSTDREETQQPQPDMTVFDDPNFFLQRLSGAPFAAAGPIPLCAAPAATPSDDVHTDPLVARKTDALKSIQKSCHRRARTELARSAPPSPPPPPPPAALARRLPRRCRRSATLAPEGDGKRVRNDAGTARSSPSEHAAGTGSFAMWPDPLNQDELDRRKSIALSLIDAATERRSGDTQPPPTAVLASPSHSEMQTHVPPRQRPAQRAPDVTRADVQLQAHRGHKRGRIHVSQTQEAAQLARQQPLRKHRRFQQQRNDAQPRPPPKPTFNGLNAACVRLMYGAADAQTLNKSPGRPPCTPSSFSSCWRR